MKLKQPLEFKVRTWMPTVGYNKEFKSRNFKITKHILEKYGYIDGCPGRVASGFEIGMGSRNAGCRSRLTNETQKIDNGRRFLKHS